MNCELNVDRILIDILQALERVAQEIDEHRILCQAIEGEHDGCVGRQWLVGRNRQEFVSCVGPGNDRQQRDTAGQRLNGRHSHLAVLFPVDHLHEALGIGAAALNRIFRPQFGMAQRNEASVVVGDSVHSASSQAGHNPQKTLTLAYLGSPAERILAKADPGHVGKKVAAVPPACHALQHDGHSLVVVDQVIVLAIEQGIRIERAGVDLPNGIQHAGEILLGRSLIRAEVTLVLAGE